MKKSILTTAFAFTVLFASAQLYVNTSNRVGIGFATPNALLSFGTGVVDNKIYLYDGFSDKYGFGVRSSQFMIYSGNNGSSTGGITFGKYDGTNFYENVRFQNGGMVGIGTATPAYKLDINGDARISYINSLYLNDGTGTGSGGGLRLFHMGAANPGYIDCKSSVGMNFRVDNNNGGIIRMTILSGGNVGIGISTPGYLLDIAGTAHCPAMAWSSDSTKKKNIKDLSLNALTIINKLRPVTFEWKKVIDDGMKGTQMGFTAQELEKVLPSIVITKNDTVISVTTLDTASSKLVTKNETVKGCKSVKYNELFPIVIKAMQEQQKMIDSLFTIVNATKGQRTNDNGSGDEGNKAATIHEMELASGNAIIYQNAPNPFGDGTTIKYFIPDNVWSAQIVFFDSFGNQIKEFKVEEKGMGQLNVSTLNLAAGVYSYSLLVNGKVIDTKKMLKSN
jgi:hypothetical protein